MQLLLEYKKVAIEKVRIILKLLYMYKNEILKKTFAFFSIYV